MMKNKKNKREKSHRQRPKNIRKKDRRRIRTMTQIKM